MVLLALQRFETSAGNSSLTVIRQGMAEPMMVALDAATQSIGLCDPNPRVGCVLVGIDGQTLGIGHTQTAGGPHAEIMALRDAQQKGASTLGATAYVTLEPCSHHGRTGPCCDALIAAGIRSVVASTMDPNPIVAGQGFKRLRAAGISVEVGIGAEESRELNIGFFSRMIRKTPWVRMKIAASLDGKTALQNGVSQWITSAEARADGHAWRARASAILTGVGTVLNDLPRLDVRLAPAAHQPAIVIADSHLRTPMDAPFLIADRVVYIYSAARNDAKKMALEARGATVIHLPGTHGQVDLTALVRDLAKREINELHVEAGQGLNGALLRENLVDEVLAYIAPKLLGHGMGMAGLGPFTELSQAVPLEFFSSNNVGPDLRIRAHIDGRHSF